jgi:hypothetical protein
VAISIAALMLTTILTLRQLGLLQRSNYIPVVELIVELRSRELYDDLMYVTNRLRAEHDPSLGISGLPDTARSAVVNVAYYFQAFAWLGELGILKAKHLGLVANRIVLTWRVIEPYVKAERQAVKGPPILTVLGKVYERLVDHGIGVPDEVRTTPSS